MRLWAVLHRTIRGGGVLVIYRYRVGVCEAALRRQHPLLCSPCWLQQFVVLLLCASALAGVLRCVAVAAVRLELRLVIFIFQLVAIALRRACAEPA